MGARLTGALPLHPRQDFAKLDFLILTHKHSDHINWPFLKSIAPPSIPWVVPEFLVAECSAQTGLPRQQIFPAIPGRCIEIAGIRINPLAGCHWEYAPGASRSAPPIKGLPSAAYLLEFHGKRWYFPGDVRSYDIAFAPSPEKLDGITAHVWLGRMQNALSEPPLLDAFCEYFSRFHTRRLILTHLYEMGRESKDMWTSQHAEKLVRAFAQRNPSIQVSACCTGDRVDLVSKTASQVG
jgi:hypothetical protein